MKIIHTADWHLGIKLGTYDLIDQMRLYINWLTQYIENNQIELIIISGDIFDGKHPSFDAIDLYHSFLLSLYKLECKAILIAGNHDSPRFLTSSKSLLKPLDINVFGSPSIQVSDDVVCIKNKKGDEKVIICALSYIKEGELTSFQPEWSMHDLELKAMEKLAEKYSDLSQVALNMNKNLPIIGTGHLFAQGAEASDIEQKIYVGNIGNVGINVFNNDYSYIALGHIHRAQAVSNKDNIRYSGSPVTLSFSESNDHKSMVLIEIKEDGSLDLQQIETPVFRNFLRWKGDAATLILNLEKHIATHELPDLVELEMISHSDSMMDRIKLNQFRQIFESKEIEIIKIIRENHEGSNVENHESIHRNIDSFTPLTLFQQLLKAKSFEPSEIERLLDVFNKLEREMNEN